MTEPPSHLASTSRRAETIGAVAASLFTLTVFLATRGAPLPVGVGYDDAIYLDLARSLAAGEGYRHGYLPGNPPGVHYPPLFPLWLALWTTLGAWTRDASTWISLGNVALSTLAAGVWTLWGVRTLRLPAWLAAAVASLSVLIFPARMLAQLAFSEPLAWLLLGGGAAASLSAGRWGVRAAIVGMLPLVRTILLPFAIALSLGEARDRTVPPRRRLIALLIALAPTVGWMAWSGLQSARLPSAWAGSYGAYSQMYAASGFTTRDMLLVAWLQCRALLSMAAEMFTGPGALVALGCLTIGMIRLARVQAWLAWGTAGYLVLVLIWPFTPERFIWGLLPLLALTAIDGGRTLLARVWSTPLPRYATIALLLLPCAAYARVTVVTYATGAWMTPLRQVVDRNAPLIRWGRSLRTPAPVATETDGLFALATGLQSFPVVTPDPADKVGRGTPLPKRVERSLCTVGSGWVALTTLDSDVAEAVRALVRDTTVRVRIGVPERVGDGAVVAPFACSR